MRIRSPLGRATCCACAAAAGWGAVRGASDGRLAGAGRATVISWLRSSPSDSESDVDPSLSCCGRRALGGAAFGMDAGDAAAAGLPKLDGSPIGRASRIVISGRPGLRAAGIDDEDAWTRGVGTCVAGTCLGFSGALAAMTAGGGRAGAALVGAVAVTGAGAGDDVFVGGTLADGVFEGPSAADGVGGSKHKRPESRADYA